MRKKQEKQCSWHCFAFSLSLSHSLYTIQYIAMRVDAQWQIARMKGLTLQHSKKLNNVTFIFLSKKYRTLSFRYHIVMSLIIQTLTVFHWIHFQITTFSDTTKSHHTATIITNSLSSMYDILEERERERREEAIRVDSTVQAKMRPSSESYGQPLRVLCSVWSVAEEPETQFSDTHTEGHADAV